MQPLTVKIPTGLVTEIAQKRFLVNAYETHRGFKALAFYLMARTLTTSNGLYREYSSRHRKDFDGYEAWSGLNRRIGKALGMNFNTVNQVAAWAQDFGFMTITSRGYQFTSLEKIIAEYHLWFPEEVTFTTVTVHPQNDSLEHILKTLVIGENFAKQEHVVLKKIKQIPGVQQKLDKYIDGWQSLSPKQLLKRIVEYQKRTFVEYSKGTEVYDFFHSIHADIALTVRRIRDHFQYRSCASAMYIKKVLSDLQYITVEKRQLSGHYTHVATRLPHEPDGSSKPLKFVWIASQQQRKWLMPDLITLNLKNT